MTTLRIILLTMAVVPVILLGIALWKPSKKKPKLANDAFVDRLIELIGNDHIEVYNGVTYYGDRNTTDGNAQKLELPTDKWFKIRIGKYFSGYGDWGGGFDHTCCAVAEVYIDAHGWILHICAPSPFDNGPDRKRDHELYKKVSVEVANMRTQLSMGDLHVKTDDMWLRGVLDTLYNMVVLQELNLWKHPMEVKKPRGS